MKLKFIKIIFIVNVSLLIEGTAFSGGMDSGGGQGFVCFNSSDVATTVQNDNGNISDENLEQINSIETLDLKEAKLPRGDNLEIPKLLKINLNENYNHFLERIISKIELNFPLLGKKIREVKSIFKDDKLIWSEIGLIQVNDNNSIFNIKTKHCSLITLAIQFKEENAYYLNIDPRLFFHSKMSEENKAILFLHEYLYFIARENGKTSSRSTRLALSYLIRENYLPNTNEVLSQLNFL